MSLKKRYRPLWVILHWLMALLVFVTFGIGLLDLTKTADSGAKLMPLAVHMTHGISILLIVIGRSVLRLLVFKPPKRAASAPGLHLKRPPLLDQLSVYVHPLLYLLTALMALLGIAIALPAVILLIVAIKLLKLKTDKFKDKMLKQPMYHQQLYTQVPGLLNGRKQLRKQIQQLWIHQLAAPYWMCRQTI